jgi:hypothetical protein
MDHQTPRDVDLHRILDTYGTHKHAPSEEVVEKAPPLPPAFHTDGEFLAQSGWRAFSPTSRKTACGTEASHMYGN